MTIVFSNPEGELASSYGTTPRTVSFSTAPTSGNMLLLGMRTSVGITGVSVTDNQGNSYTLLHSWLNTGGDTNYIFRSDNLTGTMPTSFSVAWTSGGGIIAFIHKIEAAGVDGTTPLDGTGTSTTAYGTSEDVSYTTANDNEAVLSLFNMLSARDITITEAGHSRYPTTGSLSYGLIYKGDLGAAGAKTLTYTWTTATNSVAGIVTLKQASTGGVDVNATTDALTLTEYGASVGLEINVASASQALSVTEYAATVAAVADVQVAAQALSITANAASVGLAIDVSAAVDSLSLTEYAASVDLGEAVDVQAASQSLTITEYAVSVGYSVDVTNSVATLSLSELSASVGLAINVLSASHALLLTEYPTVIGLAIDVQSATAAMTLTAYAAAVDLGSVVNVQATSVSLALTAQPVTIGLATNVQASVDEMVSTAFPAVVSVTADVSATMATLIVAGQPAIIGLVQDLQATFDALTMTAYAASIGVAGDVYVPTLAEVTINPVEIVAAVTPAIIVAETDPTQVTVLM